MQKRLLFGHRSRVSATKGFTLVELLIVLTIVAILSVATVLVLNPSEMLKKARDTQRMSDMNSIKSAIALYLTTVTSPVLGTSTDATCFGGAGSIKIWLSLLSDGSGTTGGSTTDTTPSGFSGFLQQTRANAGLVDGTGWIPVDLADTTGGSPIASWPQDPSLSVSSLAALTNADRYYRYTCNASTATSNPSTFEINAALESTYYTGASSANNIIKYDGGNNDLLYEVGTNLSLLPSTNDF